MSSRIKFARQAIAASLFAVFLVSSAASQVPDGVFRDLLGTFKHLQQKRGLGPPVGPSIPRV
jgi:hypothetical protein